MMMNNQEEPEKEVDYARTQEGLQFVRTSWNKVAALIQALEALGVDYRLDYALVSETWAYSRPTWTLTILVEPWETEEQDGGGEITGVSVKVDGEEIPGTLEEMEGEPAEGVLVAGFEYNPDDEPPADPLPEPTVTPAVAEAMANLSGAAVVLPAEGAEDRGFIIKENLAPQEWDERGPFRVN